MYGLDGEYDRVERRGRLPRFKRGFGDSGERWAVALDQDIVQMEAKMGI